MAGSLNRVQLIGHVGGDPEIRNTQAGKRITNFSIATSEQWRDKNNGEMREKTEWHRCVCFNENLTKVIEQYVKKGSKIFIEGSLATRKWTDKDDIERYSTEVTMQGFDCRLILLDRAEGGKRPPPADSPDDYGAQKARTSRQTPKDEKPPYDDLNDEIPF